jgi:hypothetical protein
MNEEYILMIPERWERIKEPPKPYETKESEKDRWHGILKNEMFQEIVVDFIFIQRENLDFSHYRV